MSLLLAITSPNADVQNSFNVRLGSKFVMKSSLKIPPHLRYVATLPCEIFVTSDSRWAITRFISSSLYSILCLTGDEDHDSHIRRSVGYAYASMLLVLVTRYSERVEWLEKFGHKLWTFTEKGRQL